MAGGRQHHTWLPLTATIRKPARDVAQYTIPAPARRVPRLANKEFSDAWKYGRRGNWQTGSYDPQLDLYYIARAMPNRTTRVSQGRQFVLSSILAIRPDRRNGLVLPERAERTASTSTPSAGKCARRTRVAGEMRQGAHHAHKKASCMCWTRTNGKADRGDSVRGKQNWAKVHRPQDRPPGSDRSA